MSNTNYRQIHWKKVPFYDNKKCEWVFIPADIKIFDNGDVEIVYVPDEFVPNNVDHPSHYNQGNIECIDAMISAYGKEAVATFCKLNAFKYLWRADNKNGQEDMHKADWYLDKHNELMDGDK